MFKYKFLFWSVLAAFILVSSCKKEDDEIIDVPDKVVEAQVLVEYLESTGSPLGKDYVNSEMPSIIKADEVLSLNATEKVYVIDIRSAEDYTTGHIPGAVNVPLADILTHVQGLDLSSYTKVAVACYTGQTAGFATSLLRLMGYDKTYSLKWGMCSWNPDFATKWQNNIGNSKASLFTSDVTEKAPIGKLPTLNTGKTTGPEILEARVQALLKEGYTPAKVSNTSVFGDLDGYYIMNYWKSDHYDIGHIPGAAQYTPKESIKLSTDLKTLPTNKPIVVYCYTGQTSSFMTAYLRLIGYDAKSLLFGANGMIYDIMVANNMTVFSDSQTHDYAYE